MTDTKTETDNPGAGLVDQVMAGMPESWDGDGSAESIVVDYVRELERRVKALGGDLEWDDSVSDARALFNTAAAEHVVSESTDSWNALVDAWDACVCTVEAERS